jgi:hypothetical protein
MIKINKNELNKIANALGFLPKRITLENDILVDDVLEKLLDELNIPYIKENLK